MKSLISIQYLRAIAAMGVVMFHAFQWAGGGFNLGRAGVDVFFVISGVIMWRVTGANEARPSAFIWKRITRVAPLYWLVTVATAGIAILWPALLANVYVRPAHLLLSLAFIPHLDPRGLPFPLLPPGWTLEYEAIFYLVFAAALFAPRRRQAAIVCAALFVIVAAGLVLDDPVYILGANPLLGEFAIGIAIARLAEMDALPGRRGGWTLAALGCVLFVVPASFGLFSELGRPFIWGIPAASVVAGAMAIEASGGAPRCPALRFLGDGSYAVYLVHLPTQALVAHTLGVANPWVFVPAACAMSIGVGLACHVWVEAPMTRWIRSWATVRPEPFRSTPLPCGDGRTAPDRSRL